MLPCIRISFSNVGRPIQTLIPRVLRMHSMLCMRSTVPLHIASNEGCGTHAVRRSGSQGEQRPPAPTGTGSCRRAHLPRAPGAWQAISTRDAVRVAARGDVFKLHPCLSTLHCRRWEVQNRSPPCASAAYPLCTGCQRTTALRGEAGLPRARRRSVAAWFMLCGEGVVTSVPDTAAMLPSNVTCWLEVAEESTCMGLVSWKAPGCHSPPGAKHACQVPGTSQGLQQSVERWSATGQHLGGCAQLA